MLTEIISLCFASYFVNGCASGKNMNGSFKKKKLSGGDLKIGYVIEDKIFSEYSKSKNAENELKKFVNEKQKELDELTKKLEELVNSGVLNDEDIERKGQDIIIAQKRMQTKIQNKEVELKTFIFNKIREAVNKYAKEQKYDYILSQNSLFYADEKRNITENIIKILESSP